MDYRRENGFSGGNVVQILTGNTGNGVDENWSPGSTDYEIWATEDEYGMWNGETSMDMNTNLNYEGRTSQSRSGSEPPSKRSRNAQSGDVAASNRSRAIGKMFYKTKLCCKFRAGTCPYITNCNFAHSLEELRKPPPNWQEILAGNDDERPVLSESREEFQIPIFGVSDDAQRSYKGRHCKKFYTDEGCPYGENCTFLHDEQSKSRESVAISLGPGSGGGYGGNGSGSNLKPSNWKTRICNKWELTGYCPFGSKCHFAHGAAVVNLMYESVSLYIHLNHPETELHRYGGGASDAEAVDSSTPDAKHGTASLKTSVDAIATVPSVPHSDVYHVGVPSQRLPAVIQKTGHRPTQKWKGPDKISKIYGDWIDDL